MNWWHKIKENLSKSKNQFQKQGKLRKTKTLSLKEILSLGAGYTFSTEEQRKKIQLLKKQYGTLTVEEIVFEHRVSYQDRILLLTYLHNYTTQEAEELLKTAQAEANKAKLKEAKIKISQKAQELYSKVPVDDTRQPISDEVKMFVWQRDGGKCVKCSSKEKLEFDHIIPVSKGGSNTERNIQLLCEKCNRSKRDEIC